MAVCPWCQHQELRAEREGKSLKGKLPGKSNRSRSGFVFAKESYKKSFSNHAIFCCKALARVVVVLCTGQSRLSKIGTKIQTSSQASLLGQSVLPSDLSFSGSLQLLVFSRRLVRDRVSLGMGDSWMSPFLVLLHFLKKSFKIKWRTILNRFPTYFLLLWVLLCLESYGLKSVVVLGLVIEILLQTYPCLEFPICKTGIIWAVSQRREGL